MDTTLFPNPALLASPNSYTPSESVPSPSVLSEHGLSKVILDPRDVAHPWVSGRAELTPTRDYPLFRHPSQQEQVHFYFSPASDVRSCAKLRQHAQFLALDSSHLASISAEISPTTERASQPKYSLVRELLAWWEDRYGLWLVALEDHDHTIDLAVWWMERQDAITAEEDEQSALSKYGELCDALFGIVQCLKVSSLLEIRADQQALESQGLCAVSCRPHQFVITSSGRVAIAQLSEGMSSSRRISQHRTSAQISMEISPWPAFISDGFLRRNLRWLAPEAVISRHPTSVSEIYSFGVLAYELLTTCVSTGQQSPMAAEVDMLTDIQRHLVSQPIPLLEYLQRAKSFGKGRIVLPPEALSDLVMRCLAKDRQERYISLEALGYDLKTLGSLCRDSTESSPFGVGATDEMSRFVLPDHLIEREKELSYLDTEIDSFLNTPTTVKITRSINIWGCSGSGKSGLVQHVTKSLQSTLVAVAKLDEHVHKPLSTFLDIFATLIEGILTDPLEDLQTWQKTIREALGNQFPTFVCLLPVETRCLLTSDPNLRPVRIAEATNVVAAFKIWSKRLLQLFATAARPLVLVVEDIQWIEAEEQSLWQSLLDGNQPLRNTLILSTSRIESQNLFASSPMSRGLHLACLSESGVGSFLGISFKGRIENQGGLARLLYAETKGNPLYLETVLTTLVEQQVFHFDFEHLTWRYDPLALQTQLSASGVDAYLEHLMSALPGDVLTVLCVSLPSFHVADPQLLSCLPSSGFSLELLGQLSEKRPCDLSALLNLAVGMTSSIVVTSKDVRFTHDRQRATAYRMIPPSQAGSIHFRVSMFLRQQMFAEVYICTAAEHAIVAHHLGDYQESEEDLVRLLIQVSAKAMLSASFVQAKKFIDTADGKS
ncbi:hypothetical protein CI109_102192 [Kwoniella shandongensis]|uniref:Protein kinase domain-containing protein n=1 Tax=Kwoniella shandongensis TaxID=1734106 RepID=A0AAJ8LI71_9TREE